MDIRFRNLFLTGIFILSSMAQIGPAAEKNQDYPDFIEQVFLTETYAIKKSFPDSDRIEKKEHILSPDQISRIESSLGWVLSQTTITVHEGYKGSKSLGYAVIAEEIGKFKPITFIVRVSVEGKVEQVEVMVYRESVGSEVKRKRFTRQFKGKTVKDRLRINRDIINITGATMSVQAMTSGVKKVLILIQELYFNQ